MLRAKFTHDVLGEEVKVVATAKDVDAYGAIGLSLKFIDDSGEHVDLPLDPSTYDELSEIASEFLYNKKYLKELEF